MQVGNNNLATDLTTAFGPDNQPYFGGQHVATSMVNTFNGTPGGLSKSAWPNCLWQTNGSTSLVDAFAHHRANGCGNAQPNTALPTALIGQPTVLISHGSYMYSGTVSGPVMQTKVTADAITGLSKYTSRTYLALGLNAPTGLGVADDLGSLFVYSNVNSIGGGQDYITKLPLCEDMP